MNWKETINRPEKQLDLSQFFDGNKLYITLKPLPKEIDGKINRLLLIGQICTSGDSGDSSVEFTEKYDGGYAADKQKLLHGVDSSKHNFTENGDPISLKTKFWDELSSISPQCIRFILAEITLFQKGLQPGEPTTGNSGTQSTVSTVESDKILENLENGTVDG